MKEAKLVWHGKLVLEHFRDDIKRKNVERQLKMLVAREANRIMKSEPVERWLVAANNVDCDKRWKAEIRWELGRHAVRGQA